VDVDQPGDGRIGISAGTTDRANGGGDRADIPDARAGFWRLFALFLLRGAGKFFLMGAINFMVGTCAIPLKSILALIRTKYWLIELLSGLLIPMSFFPKGIQRVLAWLPFEHIAYTPLQIYLGKLDFHHALIAVGEQWCWVIGLLVLAHFWWERSLSKITIHGG
jgi:ABC-2 type transport system permease protein